MEKSESHSEWKAAVDLLCRWESGQGHLDDLLERTQVHRLRWLVLEVFRHWPVLERMLGPRLARRPRPQALQVLRLALAECLCAGPAQHPRIVHHAVTLASSLGLNQREGGFINAVLRSLLREWDSVSSFSLEETHPHWLVQRWQQQFGADDTRALLAWNQQPAATYVSPCASCEQGLPLVVDYAEPTEWGGFFKLIPGHFEAAMVELQAGRAYIQDPFTRIPVGLLDAQPGEVVLDLCAAPGGKTRLLAEAMAGEGTLVAVDKPGRRLERLRTNLAGSYPRVAVIGSRVEDLEQHLDRLPDVVRPGQVDALLIDVPCSKTGVIQRRPDVRVRLHEDSLGRLVEQQGVLLAAAAGWVRPGGRLVYSTCSLEWEENAGVVESFCAANPVWRLERFKMSLPWRCRHDGGGAFLLTQSPVD